jgi:hypothetical protein
MIWLIEPDTFKAFVVFAALIPAMLAYQCFFALMSASLWDAVDRARRALSSVGYSTALETEIASTVRQARRVSVLVVLLNAALAVAGLLLWRMLGGTDWQEAPLMVAAASSACCATTLSYQYSIISSRAFVHRAAIALGAVAILGVLLSVPLAVCLVAYAVVAAVLSALLLGANRNNWLQPEYSLFWATAVKL